MSKGEESRESYESASTSPDEDDDRSRKRSAYESFVKITREQIEEVQRELCLIKLCWPEVDRARDLYLKSLPSSYCTVTDKEKLLAWYAENFRRQYHAKYPERKPLLLMCENECGVQVSETIILPRAIARLEIGTAKRLVSFPSFPGSIRCELKRKIYDRFKDRSELPAEKLFRSRGT